jgi:hypothetical protein
MMAQEIRLNKRRRSRTILATGPVSPNKSRISPPTTTEGSKYRCIVFRKTPD